MFCGSPPSLNSLIVGAGIPEMSLEESCLSTRKLSHSLVLLSLLSISRTSQIVIIHLYPHLTSEGMLEVRAETYRWLWIDLEARGQFWPHIHSLSAHWQMFRPQAQR